MHATLFSAKYEEMVELLYDLLDIRKKYFNDERWWFGS